MSFTQMSFDDPRPLQIPESAVPANPLVTAIHLHEQAKGQVNHYKETYDSADIEMIRVRQHRDELRSQLAAVQEVMDDAMRNRHDAKKRFDEACAVMNTISETVREMGGVHYGNNSFCTPEKANLFSSGQWKTIPTDTWESML